jgi:serine-type D-Ala-D-Ala carboxypeptidase (penicillin-binding protein 5/6)
VEQAAAIAFLALIGLLVVMSSQADGPAAIALKQPIVRHVAVHKAPIRSDYGITPAPAAEQVSVKLTLPLKSGLLFDVNTGRVLWSKNPTDVVPIASLTKMMTALLVATHASPNAQVLITRDALNYTGSGVGLLPLGKRVPLVALLYGLLLPSGNDAAIALADHVSGTQPRFISLMNAKARALGLACTHYTTVSGIVDQGNHSCAEDLALIAHLVLEQPLLATIVASRSAIVPFPIKGGKLFLYNNNPLLVVGYPGTDGVKTGFTDAAGVCLVATARRGRSWLGVVLLHSANTSAQAQQLLNAGFAKLGQG